MHLRLFRVLAIILTSMTISSALAESKQTAELLAKRDLYLELSKQRQDPYGFIGSKCDGLLFTSLYAIAGGEVDLFQAEDETNAGKWYRDALHSCYPKGSRSTTSRDMLLGLALYLWRNLRADKIQDVIHYGETHLWVMGDALTVEDMQGRTLMSPTLKASYYEARFRLTGKNHRDRNALFIWDPTLVGYRMHLQILHIYLRGLMFGGLDLQSRFALQRATELQPDNALAQAIYHYFTDRDQSRAIKILMNEKIFPKDRLPTSAEYCTPYLWQRDQNTDDWQPCSDVEKHHDGVDFLFAAHVILQTK